MPLSKMSQLHFLAKTETGWNYKLPKICRRKLTSQSSNKQNIYFQLQTWPLLISCQKYGICAKAMKSEDKQDHQRWIQHSVVPGSHSWREILSRFIHNCVDSDTTMAANEWLLLIERLDTLWTANTHDLQFSLCKGWLKNESNLEKVFAWCPSVIPES